MWLSTDYCPGHGAADSDRDICQSRQEHLSYGSLVSPDGLAPLPDPQQAECQGFPHLAHGLQLSPDGQRLLVAECGKHYVEVYRVEDSHVLLRVPVHFPYDPVVPFELESESVLGTSSSSSESTVTVRTVTTACHGGSSSCASASANDAGLAVLESCLSSGMRIAYGQCANKAVSWWTQIRAQEDRQPGDLDAVNKTVEVLTQLRAIRTDVMNPDVWSPSYLGPARVFGKTWHHYLPVMTSLGDGRFVGRSSAYQDLVVRACHNLNTTFNLHTARFA